LDDENIGELDDDSLSAIRASRIGFFFQSYNLVPQLTVLENIEAPLYYRGHVTAGERQRCLELAESVGLSDRLRHGPQQLSGGQQQRAGIARSLVKRPRFILADEPTGNLDTKTTDEILDLFEHLNAEGTTIIMVTHEDEVAARARRIIRLRDGVIKSDTVHRPVEQSPSFSTKAPDDSETRDIGLRSFAATIALRFRAIQLGVKSLRMHPMRSLLTVLGIFIGVASVIWLLAIGEGISAKAQEQIAALGADNIIITSDRPPTDPNDRRNIPYGVTQLDYDRLQETIPDITLTSPTRELSRRELRYKDRVELARMVGCTTAFRQLNRLEVATGHFISDPELDDKRKVCVLSAELAQKLFAYEDPIDRSLHIDADFYRVSGVLKSQASTNGIRGTSVNGRDFDQQIYIPITTLWDRFGDYYSRTEEGIPIATQVTLKIRDTKKVLPTANLVRQLMTEWHERDDFEITVPLELLEQARTTRIMFMVLMGLIAAISLVVGGIGIMNIMLATVTERTREIGIRRALGARRRDINQQFLAETAVLSIVGGLTGILGGLTCRPLFVALRSGIESTFPEMMESIPETVQSIVPTVVPWSISVAFGISMAVGVVFGLYPANRAAAMNPIEALRHVA